MGVSSPRSGRSKSIWRKAIHRSSGPVCSLDKRNIAVLLNVVMFLTTAAMLTYNVALMQRKTLLQDPTEGWKEADLYGQNSKFTNAAERAKRDVDSPFSSPGVGGATYVHWGRDSCPGADIELIYKGYAGGGSYSETGSGRNYVCLPEEPLWDEFDEAANVPGRGSMYGAEYQVPSSNFPFLDAPQSLRNHNVPCAVCRSNVRTSTIMIPARNLCYESWTLEYSGYLVSTHKTHPGGTEFVCMDRTPSADIAGFRDEDGALFYTVEGVCGSLPCPPYVAGRELTCAVCTK